MEGSRINVTASPAAYVGPTRCVSFDVDGSPVRAQLREGAELTQEETEALRDLVRRARKALLAQPRPKKTRKFPMRDKGKKACLKKHS